MVEGAIQHTAIYAGQELWHFIYKISRRSSVCSDLQSNVSVTSQPRRKWTAEEDRKLKAGVRKYGEGKWRMILNDFEFDNRTGVNLKDRWRILKKIEDY
ncbi:telomeric repeat-binding factor 1-like [Sinocyclocheilus grahami]|uniref:telomeric repeat-binding factor 1-like n=1 Tax=Sinocyclocheilus grahami TaxID=75366 RepID=UPI0007AC8072|nr:PREDICTED: telomeric repeat-binding factor 1-like [Sinocyclocheilus grahami]